MSMIKRILSGMTTKMEIVGEGSDARLIEVNDVVVGPIININKFSETCDEIHNIVRNSKDGIPDEEARRKIRQICLEP